MEFLKKLLGDELFGQVKEKLGDKKLIEDNGELIPKHRFDTVNQEKNNLKTQLDTKTKEYDTLFKKYEGTEGLKADYDKLKADSEALEAKHASEIAAMKLDHKISEKLSEVKARNHKAVKAMLDLDIVKLDGDKVLGLDEQIAAIQKDNDYMFEPASPGSTGSTGAHGRQNYEGATDGGSSVDTFMGAISKHSLRG